MKRIYVGDFKIGDDEKKAINDILKSGRISEGVKVREFEQRFADYIGCRYAVALNSGTSALMAGLAALIHENNNIAVRKNVITTPLTYIATSNALHTTGFNPVYVDVDMQTFVITPEAIKEKFEIIDDIEKYSLILPVHLMGFPCDMDSINAIAKKYGLLTFEDSSQAHGTLYKDKKCGSLSELSAFSFYIAHNIQAGEMGAITTNSQEIARLIRKIKANGRMCDCPVCTRPSGKCPRTNSDTNEDIDPRFTHDIIGYNFKTMEFQASLGTVQLKRAKEIKEKRFENVKYLNDVLSAFSDSLQLPLLNRNVSYLAYPVVIKNGIPRKKLRNELEKFGIETRPLFGCIPTQQPAYSFMKKKYEGMLPNAEFLGNNGFYVGCHQYLEESDLEYIGVSFKKMLLKISEACI